MLWKVRKEGGERENAKIHVGKLILNKADEKKITNYVRKLLISKTKTELELPKPYSFSSRPHYGFKLLPNQGRYLKWSTVGAGMLA